MLRIMSNFRFFLIFSLLSFLTACGGGGGGSGVVISGGGGGSGGSGGGGGGGGTVSPIAISNFLSDSIPSDDSGPALSLSSPFSSSSTPLLSGARLDTIFVRSGNNITYDGITYNFDSSPFSVAGSGTIAESSLDAVSDTRAVIVNNFASYSHAGLSWFGVYNVRRDSNNFVGYSDPGFVYENILLINSSESPTSASDIPNSSITYEGQFVSIFNSSHDQRITTSDFQSLPIIIEADFTKRANAIEGLVLDSNFSFHLGTITADLAPDVNLDRLNFTGTYTDTSGDLDETVNANISGSFYGAGALEVSATGSGDYGLPGRIIAEGQSIVGFVARDRDRKVPSNSVTPSPPVLTFPFDYLSLISDFVPSDYDPTFTHSSTPDAPATDFARSGQTLTYDGITYTFPDDSRHGASYSTSSTNSNFGAFVFQPFEYNDRIVRLTTVDFSHLGNTGLSIDDVDADFVYDDVTYLLSTSGITDTSLPTLSLNYTGDVRGFANRELVFDDNTTEFILNSDDFFQANFMMDVDFTTGSITGVLRDSSDTFRLGTIDGSLTGGTFTATLKGEESADDRYKIFDIAMNGGFYGDYARSVYATGSGNYGNGPHGGRGFLSLALFGVQEDFVPDILGILHPRIPNSTPTVIGFDSSTPQTFVRNDLSPDTQVDYNNKSYSLSAEADPVSRSGFRYIHFDDSAGEASPAVERLTIFRDYQNPSSIFDNSDPDIITRYFDHIDIAWLGIDTISDNNRAFPNNRVFPDHDFEFTNLSILDVTSSLPTTADRIPTASLEYHGFLDGAFNPAGDSLTLSDRFRGRVSFTHDLTQFAPVSTSAVFDEWGRNYVGDLTVIGFLDNLTASFNGSSSDSATHISLPTLTGNYYGPRANEMKLFGDGEYGVGGLAVAGIYTRTARPDELDPDRPAGHNFGPPAIHDPTITSGILRSNLSHLPNLTSSPSPNYKAHSIDDNNVRDNLSFTREVIDTTTDAVTKVIEVTVVTPNTLTYAGRTYEFHRPSIDDIAVSTLRADDVANEYDVAVLSRPFIDISDRITQLGIFDITRADSTNAANRDGNPYSGDYIADDIVFILPDAGMTTMTDLPTSSSVEYSGLISGYLNDDTTITREDFFRGRFDMTVDFATDAGSVTANMFTQTGNVPIGTLTADRGSGVDGNTFSGTYATNFSPTSFFASEYAIDMDVTGAFYGSEASEVAGIGTGTYGSNRGAIAFAGNKD